MHQKSKSIYKFLQKEEQLSKIQEQEKQTKFQSSTKYKSKAELASYIHEMFLSKKMIFSLGSRSVSINITQQPSDQTSIGGEAVFSVGATATNDTQLLYQWLQKTGDGEFMPIVGAISSSLSLSGLKPSDSANRYCVSISTPQGLSVLSDSAGLSVDAGWNITGATFTRATNVQLVSSWGITGIAFSENGYYMAIIGERTANFFLPQPWQPADGQTVGYLNVGTGEIGPNGGAWWSGNEAWITGTLGGGVVATFGVSFSIGGIGRKFYPVLPVFGSFRPISVQLSPDNKTMYLLDISGRIHEYSMPNNFSFQDPTFVRSSLSIGNFFNFMRFRPDGKRVLLWKFDSGLHEYELTSPWNISELTFIRSRSFNELSFANFATISSDGTKLLILSESSVNEYDIS